MRRLERRDFRQSFELLVREVHSDIRELQGLLPGRSQQKFFEAVCLRLDAVDQHTPYVLSVHPAFFEDMLWRIVFLGSWVRGRKNLAACAFDRLQFAAATKGSVEFECA